MRERGSVRPTGRFRRGGELSAWAFWVRGISRTKSCCCCCLWTWKEASSSGVRMPRVQLRLDVGWRNHTERTNLEVSRAS